MDDLVNLKWLQMNWEHLLGVFAVDGEAATEAFADLVMRYEEDGRFYHNLHHIENVLKTSEQLKAYAHDFTAVQLAAWFHDVIYEVQAADNEERSAVYAGEALNRLHLPAATIALVQRLIRATETHQAAAGDMDCRILLDADLATFAADPRQYDRYARAIRKEFAFVPDEAYCVARKEVLARFLERDRIFLTGQMFKRYEARARQNIHREMASLN